MLPVTDKFLFSVLNTSTLKSDEQLSNGDQLVNGGGLFSTFRGRTTMGDDEFCGQKPKVLIQLKKKRKGKIMKTYSFM